ncbi:MAG: FAD-dependent oxidoreductase [Actinomycetota bacterium]|nr:FAD-dependent oxidoreductase [Actinomycetota bacterium]
MKITLIKKNRENENIYSFIFKPEEKVTWKAGQYIFLKIPHPEPDDRGEKRHFTISSAPHEENIAVTTKFDFKNGSSFKRALIKLKKADSIKASGPEGEFIIKNPGAKYAFIAGGIGVTPYRSIILDMEKRNIDTDTNLLYFCKKREIIFKDIFNEVEGKNRRLKVYYINEPHRIDKNIIKEKVSDFKERNFYISGPFSMVKAAEDVLSNLNVAKNLIKKDYFPGYK